MKMPNQVSNARPTAITPARFALWYSSAGALRALTKSQPPLMPKKPIANSSAKTMIAAVKWNAGLVARKKAVSGKT